jgi:hypothetical protein
MMRLEMTRLDMMRLDMMRLEMVRLEMMRLEMTRLEMTLAQPSYPSNVNLSIGRYRLGLQPHPQLLAAYRLLNLKELRSSPRPGSNRNTLRTPLSSRIA